MTSTMTLSGTPLHFPSSLAVGEDGLIPAPAEDVLPSIAQQVAPEGLLLFITRLVRSVPRKGRVARWAAVNRSKLELAKLCLDRALVEGLES